jgi:UDP-glucose 4-epimerase
MCEVRNRQMVEKVLDGIDYVFHLAAVTSPPEFENVGGDGYDVNVLGTYNVLAASQMNKVKRVVIASSSVYGTISKATPEDAVLGKYGNFYPFSKKVKEMTAFLFNDYGVETVALRYFNTYGIGENSKGPYSSVI